jgi:hypothetical protein
MKRVFAGALAAGALILATARCTQLLGVEDADPYSADAAAAARALPKCAEGRASCKGEPCDTDLTTDIENCGACAVRCATVNGNATCTAGACNVACAPGFAECNQNLLDGCETSTTSDPHNCGACGHDCFGTPCVAGACLPLVFGKTRDATSWLEVDDVSAYAGSGQRIEVLPFDGSKSLSMFEGQGAIQQLQYHTGTLYVIRNSSLITGVVNEVDALSRNGQSIRCVTRFQQGTSRRFDGDPTSLAWASSLVDLDAGAPILRAVDPDASCPPPDAGITGTTIAALAVTKDGKIGESVVLDGPNAFISAMDSAGLATGTVARVDRATGALTELTKIRPLRSLSRTLAVDADYVYWIDNNVFVRRMPKAGCPGGTSCVQDVYADELGRIWSINVDDQKVYVLASDGSTSYLEIIDRADPTKVRRITADTNASGDVTYNQQFVVWAVGQKVYRVAR